MYVLLYNSLYECERRERERGRERGEREGEREGAIACLLLATFVQVRVPITVFNHIIYYLYRNAKPSNVS